MIAHAVDDSTVRAGRLRYPSISHDRQIHALVSVRVQIESLDRSTGRRNIDEHKYWVRAVQIKGIKA